MRVKGNYLEEKKIEREKETFLKGVLFSFLF